MGNTPYTQLEPLPEVEGAPIGKRWYHGNITDTEALKRMSSAAKERGDYLVYDSNGEYVLLVFSDGNVHRLKISKRLRDGRYILGEDNPDLEVESYPSVRELIKKHRGPTGRPLMMDNGKTVKLTRNYYITLSEHEAH